MLACSPPVVPSPASLLSMGCSDLVFTNYNLGSSEAFVEDVPIKGTIRVIDFETTDFFPRTWICTKFTISGGMSLLDLSAKASTGIKWK